MEINRREARKGIHLNVAHKIFITDLNHLTLDSPSLPCVRPLCNAVDGAVNQSAWEWSTLLLVVC